MFRAGITHTSLTPFWGVELTGWGYYIGRRWREIQDPLRATAIAFDDGEHQAVLITLDLMVIDQTFTARTRSLIEQETGLTADSILLNCSHSHNAPAAGGLLGVGVCDPLYEQWASRQAATAAILAWRSRQPAKLRVATTEINDLSFNRTRTDGIIDPTLTAARIDRTDGSPMAVIVNFGAHPTVTTTLRPWHVGRDIPGRVCDLVEAAMPGAIAMYVQGACGDVNFLHEYSTPQRSDEPARRITQAALGAIQHAQPVTDVIVGAATRVAELPTRRWTIDELRGDRDEALRRLENNDIRGWRDGFGRAMTNRPDDMVARHGGDELKAVQAMCRFHIEWTDLMLRDYENRPEILTTEVQAVRVGDLWFVANSSEFFSPMAIEVRKWCEMPNLMIACYSNGRIGYLPDEHDIDLRSYAGYQSPKYCNQFPFTAESGPAMCQAMLDVLADCRDESKTLGHH
jgi:hypothetical protein